MKQIFYFLLLVAIGSFSCTKDDVVQTDTQVGSSKITYYATVTIKGDQYMSVVKDGTFTDPGATAVVDGEEIQVTTSGSVNTAVPGLYTITYTGTNSDGYSSSGSRTVAVLPDAANASSNIAGSYVYVANTAYSNTITKVASGLYNCSNTWGASTIPALLVCVDGTNIFIYSQSSPFGTLSTTTGSSITSTGRLTLEITIPSQDISGSKRVWQKQ